MADYDSHFSITRIGAQDIDVQVSPVPGAVVYELKVRGYLPGDPARTSFSVFINAASVTEPTTFTLTYFATNRRFFPESDYTLEPTVYFDAERSPSQTFQQSGIPFTTLAANTSIIPAPTIETGQGEFTFTLTSLAPFTGATDPERYFFEVYDNANNLIRTIEVTAGDQSGLQDYRYNVSPDIDNTYSASIDAGAYEARWRSSDSRRAPSVRVGFGVAASPAITPPPAIIPPIQVTQITDTSAVVVSSIAGLQALILQVASDAEFENVVVAGAPRRRGIFRVTGLTPATTYYARVRGISSSGGFQTEWAYAEPFLTTGTQRRLLEPPPVEVARPGIDISRRPVSLFEINFGDAYGTGDDIVFYLSSGGEIHHDGKVYVADGELLRFDALPSTCLVERRKFGISLSASSRNIGALLNTRAYVGKPVKITMAEQDRKTGSLYSLHEFTYYANSHTIAGETAKLVCENVWGQIDRQRGRSAAAAEQRQLIRGGFFEGVPRTAVDSDLAFDNADVDYSDILLGAIIAEDYRNSQLGTFTRRPQDTPDNFLDFGGVGIEDDGENYIRPVMLGRTYTTGSLIAAWNPVNVSTQINVSHPWADLPDGAFESTRYLAAVYAISEGVLGDLWIVFSGETAATFVGLQNNYDFRRTSSGDEGFWRIQIAHDREEITTYTRGEQRTIALVQNTFGADRGGRLLDFEAISGNAEWTSRHLGYGTALCGVLISSWEGYNQNVPNINFYTSGTRVRLSRDSAETAPTENPALLLRHLLLQPRYGARLKPEQVDEDSFFDGASLYERQFPDGRHTTTIRGVISGRDTIRKALNGICNCSQSLLIAGHDGKVRLRVRHVLTTEERASMERYRFGLHNTTAFTMQQQDGERRFNSAIITTKVMDKKPGDRYTIGVELPAAVNEDGGELREMRVDAAYIGALLSQNNELLEDTKETLQECGRAAIMRSRLLRKGSFMITGGLWAYPELSAGDVVYFRNDRMGFYGDHELECRIEHLDIDHNGSYRVRWVEYSDDAYDSVGAIELSRSGVRLPPARSPRRIRPGETMLRLAEKPIFTFTTEEDQIFLHMPMGAPQEVHLGTHRLRAGIYEVALFPPDSRNFDRFRFQIWLTDSVSTGVLQSYHNIAESGKRFPFIVTQEESEADIRLFLAAFSSFNPSYTLPQGTIIQVFYVGENNREE